MDLLDVGVAADDVLHAVQVLRAARDDEAGAVEGEGRRRLERDARAHEEALDRHFLRIAVGRTDRAAGSTERIGGRAAGGGGVEALAGHLDDGGLGQLVELGVEQAVARILADLDDARRADGETVDDALAEVVKSLEDRDIAELQVDVGAFAAVVDEDDVHALLILVVGLGEARKLGERPVQRLIAGDETLGQADGLHLLGDRVVAIAEVGLDVLSVEHFGELPGLIEEFHELALGHAAIPLTGVLGQHLADADLVGLGLGIIRLVLEDFTVGVEGALVVAVEVAGTAPDEELIDLVVLDADARGQLVDIAVGRVVALGGKFLLETEHGRILLALELGVVGDEGRGAGHVAGFDGDECAAGERGALGRLDAFLEVLVGEAVGSQRAVGGVQVGDRLIDGFSGALAEQLLGGVDGVVLLGEGDGVFLGEAPDLVPGGGSAAGIATDGEVLLREGDGVAQLLGRGGRNGYDGALGAVQNLLGALEVTGGGLGLGGLNGAGDFVETVLVDGRDFVEGARRGRGDSGCRRGALGVSRLLGSSRVGEGGVDGGQAFVGTHVLGVDREDRFKFLLGDLEVTFVAGLEGLSEQHRLAGGGVAILGDERADGEREGESGPSELRTVDFFHGWGL